MKIGKGFVVYRLLLQKKLYFYKHNQVRFH